MFVHVEHLGMVLVMPIYVTRRDVAAAHRTFHTVQKLSALYNACLAKLILLGLYTL